ncbi:101 kDa malaria antigen [Brachypodium distachyon]|uniref:Uncharacterized protein n=1 Tax=Brachypodium distachyon TaxID=15368 RepID=A0A0Q3JAY2_BRADI|nr:101 kDa malaria antigen [Brachypodium distachyon]KQJ95456.1 hypothetical protein BRADI_3g17324v3 [Brachypodium distachyon]|eukprot:XP_003573512.1 101 kDa malaria antigen [Brachypodium distachyon]
MCSAPPKIPKKIEAKQKAKNLEEKRRKKRQEKRRKLEEKRRNNKEKEKKVATKEEQVAKETNFDFWGIIFVTLAAVMSGFRWSMTQILLQP